MNEELTILEVEETLERIATHKATIKEAAQKRDTLINYYQAKIERANHLFDLETTEAQQEIEYLTEVLRKYAVSNLPRGKKSIKMPSGTLSFRKQGAKFYDSDGCEITAKSKPLMDVVKNSLPQFVTIKQEESVAWGALKSHLSVDGEQVFYLDEDTGELKLLEGIHGENLPDKFTVETP